MMTCGNCDNAIGGSLGLYRTKVKCIIDNQIHSANDTCDYDYLAEYQPVVKECEICGNKYYEIDRTICPECRERLKRLLYDED